MQNWIFFQNIFYDYISSWIVKFYDIFLVVGRIKEVFSILDDIDRQTLSETLIIFEQKSIVDSSGTYIIYLNDSFYCTKDDGSDDVFENKLVEERI